MNLINNIKENTMNCFECTNREGSDSIKWDKAGMLLMAKYVDDQSLPLWVADMDFKTVPLLIENLKNRMEDGIYGYSICKDCYYEAIQYWYKKHYQWDIDKEWIVTTPGVVPALAYIVQVFTEEGDGVIIQEPVYYPFRNTIEINNRNVVNNELKEDKGHYTIDFEDLQEKAKDPKNKLMILCSPHNPIGRIWTKEELLRIAQICYENDTILCSDEIHSDLILSDDPFITTGILPEELVKNILVCTAPSKTFNLAALSTSNIIITNPELKEKLLKFMAKISLNGCPSMLGNIAVKSVYTTEGEAWLSELKQELKANLQYVKEFIAQNIPSVKVYSHQGTYLTWLDFRETGLSWEEIERKMEEEAKLVLDPGSKFGNSGRGFMRLNIACHRSTLEQALTRIQKVYA